MSAIAEPESTESGFQAGRYAAIDIGTVTCRMLVADVDEAGRLHELDREYTITNLGEGVDATGVLKPAAMQRVADAVARFLDVLRGFATPEHPAITTRAMATSAARDARNADEFEAAWASRCPSSPASARRPSPSRARRATSGGSACSWWTSAAARPRSSPGARAAGPIARTPSTSDAVA